MRFQSLLLLLQALLLGTTYSKSIGDTSPSSNSTTTAGFLSNLVSSFTGTSFNPPTSDKCYLSCQPTFPMADVVGAELFVEFCTVIGTEITYIMTRLNITEREVRYIDPKDPKQLLAIDAYAAFEIQYGCRAYEEEKKMREKMHCPWLAQLRGEITQLLAKMGGQDDDDAQDDGINLETLLTILMSIRQVASEASQELAAFESFDLRQSHQLTLIHNVALVEQLRKYRTLVERAAELEKDVGCPERGLSSFCDLFGKIKEAYEPILAMGPRLEEVLMDAKNEPSEDEL